MNFSHKLDAFEASIFTELLEAKLALRKKGMDTIDLSIGTPDLTQIGRASCRERVCLSV